MADKSQGTTVATRGATGLEPLKKALNAESVRQQFDNALKDKSGVFIASIIDLVGSDENLQECDPKAIIMECLKAATLDLPINKQLGQAYIIPYKKQGGASIPQFQMGYKGYIQLAMRTGAYKFLNVGIVCEGIDVNVDLLTGATKFSGKKTSDKPQGYFAHMELLNGFTKTVYMTAAEVLDHAKKYSKSWMAKEKAFNPRSAWATHFDEMAQKTTTRMLLSKFGYLSVEMVKVLSDEDDDDFQQEKAENANKEIIDVPAKAVDGEPKKEEPKAGDPGF